MSTTKALSSKAASQVTRINVTVRRETWDRLQEARNKRKVQINVSGLADTAINAELDRRDNPVLSGVVERLKVERDRRRGATYRLGFAEGHGWASQTASWSEICSYGEMTEADVEVAVGKSADGYSTFFFNGTFQAPYEDYDSYQPETDSKTYFPGAPAYYEEALKDWELRAWKCEEYWRGWLSAVKALFDAAKDELGVDKPTRIPTIFDVLNAALAPRLAVGTTAKQVAKRFLEGDIVTHPAFGRGAVVKSTVTKTDEELVIRFDTTGIKILSGRLAPLTKSAIIEPLDAPL